MNQVSNQQLKLRQFKTINCNGCSQKQSPYYFNCDKYHSINDKRRNPYSPDGQLLYEEYYVPNSKSQKICLNFIEYLYHPKVFKLYKCTRINCQKICSFCSYYHNDQQKRNPINQKDNHSFYDQISKQLNSQTNIIPQKDGAVLEIINKMQLKVNMRMQIQSKLVHQLAVKSQFPSQNKQQNATNKSKESQIQRNINGYVEPPELSYYSYGEELGIIEDRHHEFKMFKNFVMNDLISLIMKYVVGFLNSEGGILYLGVNDSSLVHGIQINQKQYDFLLVGIDQQGKRTVPPLMPQKYRVRRVPVYNYQNKELYVIQVRVKQNKKSYLTVYNRQCFMRMNASIQSLSVVDLIEYQKINLRPTLEITELSMSQLQSMSLQQLGQYKKKIQSSLQNIDIMIQKKIRNL